MITLTTHTPFHAAGPSEQEIYPHPRRMIERDINNMRDLDNCLREYVMSLGGDTTVVIYADHPIEEGEGDLQPDQSPGRQYTCLIYDSEQDLSKVQKTRHDRRLTDGSWNLVDLATYLRGQIKRNCSRAEPVPAESSGAAAPATEVP